MSLAPESGSLPPTPKFVGSIAQGGLACSFYYTEDGACVTSNSTPVGASGNMDIVDMVDTGETLTSPAPKPSTEVQLTEDFMRKLPDVMRDDDPVHPDDDTEPYQPDLENKPSAAPLLHEDLFQAVLAGETVQWKRGPKEPWEDLRNRAFALRMLAVSRGTTFEFRKKPVTKVLWGMLYSNRFGASTTNEENARRYAREEATDSDGEKCKVLRLEIDDDLNIINARSEAP